MLHCNRPHTHADPCGPPSLILFFPNRPHTHTHTNVPSSWEFYQLCALQCFVVFPFLLKDMHLKKTNNHTAFWARGVPEKLCSCWFYDE